MCIVAKFQAEKSPLSYALFVSFFPQLVAGPIERAGNLLGQLKEKHTMRGENLLNGFWLMLRGFYKKVVVADYLAVYVDKVYAAPQDAGGIGTVLGNGRFLRFRFIVIFRDIQILQEVRHV